MKPLEMPAIGNTGVTAVTAPSTDSEKPLLTQRTISAGKQVQRLFSLVLLPDVGDPEAFLSAATLLFADYASHLGDKAVPILATKSDRPTLKLMKDVLDELNNDALESQQKRDDVMRALPHIKPRPKRTPEEQARIDKLCDDARAAVRGQSTSTPKAG